MLAKALLGAGKSAVPAYIEDVFSTWLYTGNGATQTITNGIDLAGKGGMVLGRPRNIASDISVFDSIRGSNWITTGGINAEFSNTGFAMTTTGFSMTNMSTSSMNNNTSECVAWSFRKQTKFFDVVTYTGNGFNRTISHNLGSVPGCIMVKRTNANANWQVYHNGLTSAANSIQLNLTNPQASATTVWNSTAPTSTVFSVGTDATVNASGSTYIAYLFAHNAGGFGLTGTDNVISCGSYTGSSGPSFPVITLGYEPQWVLIKRTDTGSANDWMLFDNMRGFGINDIAGYNLKPNLSSAEQNLYTITPTATGFRPTTNGAQTNGAGATYIYIAIRRGPMKTPTTGTEVFGLNARTGTGANATVTGGTGSDDAVLIKNRGSGVQDLFASRLTGTPYLVTSLTGAELANEVTILQANPWDVMDGIKVATTSGATNQSGNTFINYLFRRAPGFFDVVCYTGTLTTLNVSHNLGAVPQLIITKSRSAVGNWTVQPLSNGTQMLRLNTTAAQTSDAGPWNNTNPTNSVFTLGADTGTNSSGVTYVAYLFATVTGVSKVGSYTGNGSSQTIACGFTAGARFVMIKRTDNTGSWYVWDTARGIVAGNDPYFLLNSSAAEVTTDDTIDPDNSGFIVNQVAATNVNVTSATYIFLAIA